MLLHCAPGNGSARHRPTSAHSFFSSIVLKIGSFRAISRFAQHDRDLCRHAGLMPTSILCRLGHVATTRQLAAHRVTGRQIRLGIELGTVNRLRRGILACVHLDEATAQAAEVGGAVTCVSVLRQAGVWAGHGSRPHVQIPPTAARVPVHSLTTAGVLPRYHWERSRFGMETPWRVTPMQALWQAMRCLDEEHAIAAMESAVHENFLTTTQVMRLARLAPRRLEDGIHRLIVNSGSGNETIVRLRLQRVGYRVEAQGYVPGMGHEDLVVEDCVGLDVDGRQWHESDDRFANDRDRDLHVEGLGRHTLRLRASHIYDSWPHTLAVIDRVVSDAKREAERRQGRVLVAFDDPL